MFYCLKKENKKQSHEDKTETGGSSSANQVEPHTTRSDENSK